MAQAEFLNKTYRRVDPGLLLPVLANEQFWYREGPVSELIDELIDNPQAEEDKETGFKKKEFVGLIAECLREGKVFLGDRKEGFNDDDRWRGEFNPNKLETPPPDTVVIHHTATSPSTSFDEIDALGLLRLYVPLYRTNALEKDQPISSGHFLGERQIFVGYHDLIWPTGIAKRVLKGSYTGFHAGSYPVNCRSYGIAFVGDLRKNAPSEPALTKARALIGQYNVEQIIGHKDVIAPNGKYVATECPGDTFYQNPGWRNRLRS